MSTRTAPLVSIGLPVRNGERYLQQAIDTVLQQTCRDLELVISDNASTDATPQICARALATDPRVRYVRIDQNRGAAWNYNRTLALSRGRYFKWAAHDDYMAPECIERAVEALEAAPDAVLCSIGTIVVGPDGERLHALVDNPDLSQASRLRRYRAFHDFHARIGNLRCNSVFGLIRRDALATTPGIGAYFLSDIVLLGELALHGRFVDLPDLLFFRRHHAERAMFVNRTLEERVGWLDPDRRELSQLPRWKCYREHARSVLRVPMPLTDRLGCFRTLLRSSHWRGVLKDMRNAVPRMLRRPA